MNPTTFDAFTLSYVETALWASTDEDGEPLDGYSIDDIHDDSLAKMVADCADFQEYHGALIKGREEEAAHDFWLTRNHHGAGFWDGDWTEPFGDETLGEHLTDVSHAYGSADLYFGDDGYIHLF